MSEMRSPSAAMRGSLPMNSAVYSRADTQHIRQASATRIIVQAGLSAICDTPPEPVSVCPQVPQCCNCMPDDRQFAMASLLDVIPALRLQSACALRFSQLMTERPGTCACPLLHGASHHDTYCLLRARVTVCSVPLEYRVLPASIAKH